MAVIVEAYSVLIRIEAVRSSFVGGPRRFLDLVPNQTLCGDGMLCRVGFMVLEDAMFFANQLFGEGLAAATDETIESPDIALAVQTGKMVYPCTWIQLDQFEIGSPEKVVWGASIKGAEDLPLAFPDGWTYDRYQSLSMADPSKITDATASTASTREVVDENGNVRYIGRPYYSSTDLPN